MQHPHLRWSLTSLWINLILNNFNAHLETNSSISDIRPFGEEAVLTDIEHDVKREFRTVNTRKATGPDEVSSWSKTHFTSSLLAAQDPLQLVYRSKGRTITCLLHIALTHGDM